METVIQLLAKINDSILNPLIALMFAVAIMYFLWGMFEFIKGADNSEARKTGQSHMIWGVIGLFIMVSVISILKIIINTLGVDTPENLKLK